MVTIDVKEITQGVNTMANGIFKKIGGIFTTEQTDTHPLPATDTQKNEKVVKAKKRNEKSYERYRGKGHCKSMSYYVPDYLLKALELKKSRCSGVSKSDLVVEGLKHILSAEIKELKEKGEISL